MSSLFRPTLLSLCVALAAASGVAWAQESAGWPPPHRSEQAPPEPRQDRRDRGNASSLSDAVRRVQRSTGGQILGAERVPFDGRDINRVKYMDDRGRVRYMDDPQPERAAPRPPRFVPPSPPTRGDNSGP